MPNFLARVAAWIVAGYPEGVPGPDRVPLLALLRRRLTDDEIGIVVADLSRRARGTDVDATDIGSVIRSVTADQPTAEDIERVRERLAVQGWPLDEPHDTEDTS
ncbi:DUF3349 domain-containing protein [Mycobacterium sp. SMC-4]|uniref:DUF3349 domain-containing protein n=1 Tax=Mycobacterium sp. SMC-4 TaxID=2857059 RepID=UPI003CFD25BF